MSHLGRARAIRAGAVVAMIAGAVTIGLSGGAGAAPVPFPAGTTTFRFSSATTITALGMPSTITLTGQMVGTSDGKGNITFPASGVTINPTVLKSGGQNVNVTTVADGTTTATIDTTTGVVTLTGSITQTLNLAALLPGNTACKLGPVAQKFSSANTGGKKYTPSATTATATVAGSVAIPTIANSTSCPNGTTISGALGKTGAVVDSLTIFPPGVAVPSTTTTTTTTTTTVAPATTEPPVTAAAAASTLPRTGSSSGSVSLVGGGLLLAGLAALGLTRKRRTVD